MSIFSPAQVEASSLSSLEPTPIVETFTIEECNCYRFVKSKVPNFPNTADIVANSIYPVVGGVIILQYKVPHYVLVEKVLEEGVWISESNYGGCGYSKRFLTWENLKSHSAQYWYQDI